MRAIYERELKAYFQGIMGYLFIAFILLFAGIFVLIVNLAGGQTYFEYVLGNMSFIFLVAIPILSMRVISEERRQKTDQLLYALPMSMFKIVLGKYLAMVTVMAIPTVIIGIYPLILSSYGNVNLLTSYSALLAFFFLGASLLAIGMFVSSVTENPVVSAALCFLVMMINYFVADLAGYVPSSAAGSFVALTVCAVLIGLFFKLMTKDNFIAFSAAVLCEIPLTAVMLFNKEALVGMFPQIMKELSVFQRFYVFIDGTCDITAFVYFLSVIAVFVYLTVQSLERRRWN